MTDDMVVKIDEMADNAAMFIFQELGLDYDDPTNKKQSRIVRERICLSLDAVYMMAKRLDNSE